MVTHTRMKKKSVVSVGGAYIGGDVVTDWRQTACLMYDVVSVWPVCAIPSETASQAGFIHSSI